MQRTKHFCRNCMRAWAHAHACAVGLLEQICANWKRNKTEFEPTVLRSFAKALFSKLEELVFEVEESYWIKLRRLGLAHRL